MVRRSETFTISEANRRIWGNFIPDYVDDRVRKIVSILPVLDDKEAKYLDIGCSSGVTTELCAKRMGTTNVFGIDLVHTEDAQRKGICTFSLDLNAGQPLPFENNYFQVVTCLEVLEHVQDPDYLISEIYRVLKKDGIAIIDVPRLDSLMNIFLLCFGYQPPGVECSIKKRYGAINQGSILTGHTSYFTKKALFEMVRSHQFKILEFFQVSQMSNWQGVQKKLGRRVGIGVRFLWVCYDRIPCKKDFMIIKITKE